MKKKVFVGLSGGVDSSVSAALLKEQGFDVTAVFMKNWSGEDYGVDDLCPWEEDLEVAKEVADHLGVELKVYNFEKEYRELVVKDFFAQYALGNTPNPDVLCNKFIKFDKFLNKAISEGADFIATGHYAKAERGQLLKARDKNKDQTYFLHQLTKEQLERTLFPLGDLTKPQVRKLALKFELPNANRKDSQGICFIGKIDIVEFLKKEIEEKEGEIVDADTGERVGKHRGVWFHTIGQRKGLGIGGAGKPYFVCEKDPENNRLYVTKGKESPLLLKNRIEVKDLHLINPEVELQELTAVIRYRATEEPVKLTEEKGENMVFDFINKVWAPAIGQSLVLYKDEVCLGGGVIQGTSSID